jgi:hypothetical protein
VAARHRRRRRREATQWSGPDIPAIARGIADGLHEIRPDLSPEVLEEQRRELRAWADAGAPLERAQAPLERVNAAILKPSEQLAQALEALKRGAKVIIAGDYAADAHPPIVALAEGEKLLIVPDEQLGGAPVACA